MLTLGLLDLSGIQEVIFRSSKLKEIAAASEMIEQLSTKGGLYDQIAGAHKVVAAGGNLAVSCASRSEVSAILKELQYKLICNYSGLEAVTAMIDYDAGTLAQHYARGLKELERNKLTTPRSVHLHHPGWQDENQHAPTVANAVWPPTNHRERGELNIDDLICEVWRTDNGNHYDEKSGLMAVVSVDGLSMGKRIIDWLGAAETAGLSDEVFKSEFLKWSDSIRDRWNGAWDAAISAINSKFVDNEWQHPHQPRYLDNRGYYPYRKIYQGGDDLCFLCDAHIAMAMTTTLVENLQQPRDDVNELFKTITSSAGILYVNKKYPFARAVQLADAVRQAAKKKTAKAATGDSPPASIINWWLNRQGELEAPQPLYNGDTQRPYLLKDDSTDLHNLLDDAIPLLWQEFGESRGLLKSLIEAAQAGANGEHVARALKLRSKSSNSTSDEPFVGLPAPFNTPTGFAAGGSETILLDAGELYDLYFPLEKGQE